MPIFPLLLSEDLTNLRRFSKGKIQVLSHSKGKTMYKCKLLNSLFLKYSQNSKTLEANTLLDQILTLIKCMKSFLDTTEAILTLQSLSRVYKPSMLI